MIDTTDPTDASSAVAAADDRAWWNGRFAKVGIGCLVVEAAVIAVAAAGLVGTWGATLADPPIVPVTSFSSNDEDIGTFLIAWRRSLDSDHAATGTVTRTALDANTLLTSAWPAAADPFEDSQPPKEAVLSYRRAVAHNRWTTQIGDVATVVDPLGARHCLRHGEGFVCSPDEEPGVEDVLVAVEAAVRGQAATHRITRIDPSAVKATFPALPSDIACWETRSVTDGVDQRWGRRAQFCFDQQTGAAVFRRILGTTRLEVLVVDSVSDTVSPSDLDPA